MIPVLAITAWKLVFLLLLLLPPNKMRVVLVGWCVCVLELGSNTRGRDGHLCPQLVLARFSIINEILPKQVGRAGSALSWNRGLYTFKPAVVPCFRKGMEFLNSLTCQKQGPGPPPLALWGTHLAHTDHHVSFSSKLPGQD